MVVLSTLLLAAGLASQAKASPTGPVERSSNLNFIPDSLKNAIGYTTIPPAGLANAGNIPPPPQIKQFTPEEFQAWLSSSDSAVAARADAVLTDTRYPESTANYPFDAIGRLYMPITGGYAWCSGTLVGPRLMAAARHCIDSAAEYFLFEPGYANGDVYPSAYVTEIVSLSADSSIGDCDLKNDWALYVLGAALGTERGYFSIGNYTADLSIVENKAVLFNAGYPGDLSAGGQQLYMSDSRTSQLLYSGSCANGGPITANAYVAGGMSGGPLWRLTGTTRYTYGGLFGTGLDGNGNELYSIHSWGDSFIQGVQNLNAQFPS